MNLFNIAVNRNLIVFHQFAKLCGNSKSNVRDYKQRLKRSMTMPHLSDSHEKIFSSIDSGEAFRPKLLAKTTRSLNLATNELKEDKGFTSPTVSMVTGNSLFIESKTKMKDLFSSQRLVPSGHTSLPIDSKKVQENKKRVRPVAASSYENAVIRESPGKKLFSQSQEK